jgi:hypothetical protein
MFTQILSAQNQLTSHLTFPFPLYFGANTAHRCWIQPPLNPVNKQNHRFFVSLWSPETNTWGLAKCKLTASIILLYTCNNPSNPNHNLPETLSIDLRQSSVEEILSFISPDPTGILPTRLFTNVQRILITKALIAHQHLTPIPASLWLSSPELDVINNSLPCIQASNNIGLPLKVKFQKVTLQTKIFRAYTANKYGKEAGWDTPEELNSHEWHICDEQGRLLEQNTANWQNNLLVYTHMFDLPTLALTSSLSPYKITNLAQIIENITGTPPRMPQAPT